MRPSLRSRRRQFSTLGSFDDRDDLVAGSGQKLVKAAATISSVVKTAFDSRDWSFREQLANGVILAAFAAQKTTQLRTKIAKSDRELKIRGHQLGVHVKRLQ